MVIGLCGFMMVAEIVGGLLFGSIALVADGLHMSTHASALLLTALAYSYARRHADDARFSFGTGKLGDLAGYPAVGRNIDLRYSIDGHPVRIRTINLDQHWTAIHDQLLGILSEVAIC
jgi:Cation efflux family